MRVKTLNNQQEIFRFQASNRSDKILEKVLEKVRDKVRDKVLDKV